MGTIAAEKHIHLHGEHVERKETEKYKRTDCKDHRKSTEGLTMIFTVEMLRIVFFYLA